MTVYLLRRRKLGRTSCKAIKAFSKMGIQLYRNDKELPVGGTCIRWGCTSNVPTNDIINNADGIHRVSNKNVFRLMMQAHRDKMGGDYLCPPTYTEEDETIDCDWPVIVRPMYHHQGRQLYFCTNMEEFEKATIACGGGWYASPFIDKVAEYRVFCMQGRVLCITKKTPADPKAIAWNVAQGGRFDNVKWDGWPLKACRIALEAHSLTSLHFSGVDIMVDKKGTTYVLEANSAPSLTSPYRQECFAKGIDYMIKNGKAPINLSPNRGGYKKFIHPAVCKDAW